MRLFASISIPTHVHDHLALALSGIKSTLPPPSPRSPIRWIDPENWHVTLAFYGEISESSADLLSLELQSIARDAHPFTVHLATAGSFSKRSLWVGVGGDMAAMKALGQAAGQAGAFIGARPEARERNRPHVTVARARGNGEFGAQVRALSVYRGPQWEVERIELLKSEPGSGRGGGSLYTPYETIFLGMN